MAVTQSLARTTLFNSFAVFREILQGITAFTTIFPNADFQKDARYFEDEPNTKSKNFIGYPIITIDTDSDDEHISYTGLKQMNFTTRVTIMTDYDVERTTPRLNRYMNAVANHFNLNQTTLLRDYNLDGIRITKARDRDEINEKQLILGILTFDYVVKLDMEN